MGSVTRANPILFLAYPRLPASKECHTHTFSHRDGCTAQSSLFPMSGDTDCMRAIFRVVASVPDARA